MSLFEKFQLGNIELKNKVVMAPMTRSRAINNIPNDLMAEYYSQRASAGLLITEGVSPSPNGLGYPRIPGVFNQEQMEGWKLVTDAVHAKGGKIFLQMMHTGRVSHSGNMQEGTKVLAPSAIQLSGEMYTDSQGMQAYPVPAEMTADEINSTQDEYVNASKLAIEAGFDGVELHGANGYLMDQFINTASNKRTDAYGGSFENRNRFALEVARKVVAAIGADKTAIRLSPFGAFNDMEMFDEMEDSFEHLASELGKMKLCYLHVVDHSAMGAPPVSDSVKEKMKQAFGGVIIASGGFDNTDKANAILQANKGDLIAFGRPFISNPDLVARLETNTALAMPDFDTFYSPGEKGYTDYPVA